MINSYGCKINHISQERPTIQLFIKTTPTIEFRNLNYTFLFFCFFCHSISLNHYIINVIEIFIKLQKIYFFTLNKLIVKHKIQSCFTIFKIKPNPIDKRVYKITARKKIIPKFENNFNIFTFEFNIQTIRFACQLSNLDVR